MRFLIFLTYLTLDWTGKHGEVPQRQDSIQDILNNESLVPFHYVPPSNGHKTNLLHANSRHRSKSLPRETYFLMLISRGYAQSVNDKSKGHKLVYTRAPSPHE